MAAGLIKPAHTQVTALGGEAVGKPGMAGAHTNQRLSLSKPWEGLRRTCRGFEPDSGNLTVRDYRGASRNVRHGEIVTPSRDRKSGNGNPFTYSGARSNSIPTAKRARKAETLKQTKPFPKVARAVPLSRPWPEDVCGIGPRAAALCRQ